MKNLTKHLALIFILLGLATPVLADDQSMHQPPLVAKIMMDKLEATRSTNTDGLRWDASAWYGSVLNRFWLKSEGEHVDNRTQQASVEALLGHAIAPFWDVQLGARYDVATSNTEARSWASLGVQGLAPYRFELDAAIYLGDNTRTAARFSGSYTLRITQRLLLKPDVEVWLYGKDDIERGIGKGLAHIESGLRLRYEITRRVAPYIGVSRQWLFDDTRQLASTDVHAATTWLVGIKLWL